MSVSSPFTFDEFVAWCKDHGACGRGLGRLHEYATNAKAAGDEPTFRGVWFDSERGHDLWWVLYEATRPFSNPYTENKSFENVWCMGWLEGWDDYRVADGKACGENKTRVFARSIRAKFTAQHVEGLILRSMEQDRKKEDEQKKALAEEVASV